MDRFQLAIDAYKTNPDWGTNTHDENKPQNMEGWDEDDEQIDISNDP